MDTDNATGGRPRRTGVASGRSIKATDLTADLRGHVDAAFLHRLHSVVHFPDPDAETRRRLWDSFLGRAGTMDPADPIDVADLATALEPAGGEIRNIMLAATFDAVIEDSPSGRRHLAAARREYGKSAGTCPGPRSEDQAGRWVHPPAGCGTPACCVLPRHSQRSERRPDTLAATGTSATMAAPTARLMMAKTVWDNRASGRVNGSTTASTTPSEPIQPK